MPNYQSQEFLFQRIKELLGPDDSMVDSVAEILHISTDSAYRRIRGETPIVLDEARELCLHFELSLDTLLNVRADSTLFQNIRINPNLPGQPESREMIHSFRLCAEALAA